MTPFLTIAGPAECEIRVRGSRFIAASHRIDDEAAAQAFLARRSRVLFDATHHCAAWRLRDGRWRSLDAGEPTGTAGAPILAALDQAGLRDAAIVVSRYFGGTKLGVGGLARAYGEAARAVIERTSKRLGVPGSLARIRYVFAFTPQVMRALELFGAESILHGFDARTNQAELSFALETSKLEEMAAYLRNTSSDSLRLEVLEAVFLYRPWAE